MSLVQKDNKVGFLTPAILPGSWQNPQISAVSIARNLAPDQQVDVRLTAFYSIDNRILLRKVLIIMIMMTINLKF